MPPERQPFHHLMGRHATLEIRRFGSPGAFLAERGSAEDADVLLLLGPEIPPEAREGDELAVFVSLDSEGRPLATTKVPKLTLGEVEGRNLFDTFPNLAQPRFKERILGVLQTGAPTFFSSTLNPEFFPCQRPNGRPRIQQTALNRLRSPTGESLVLITISDVTDQHERGEAGLTPVPLASLGYDGITGFLLLREDTAAFATKDASVAFDHGGNSPQERIIPVLTVSRKLPEGAAVASYAAEVKAEDDALGYHRLSLRLVFPPGVQNNLAYVGPRTVDLDLRVPGRVDIRAMVREVAGSGKLKAGRIQAPVKEEWVEVFFSLEGPADERVQVEVFHPDNIHRVEPAMADRMFVVVGTKKDAVALPRSGWESAIETRGHAGSSSTWPSMAR